MAFTYRTGTDVGKVRLFLGDDTENSGVRPDGTNFSDAEINVYLTREGSVERAVAGLAETLALQYARMVNLAVGPRREDLSRISEAYAEMAKYWRSLYGGAAAAFGIGVIRVDGYSDDVTSDDVDATSEYTLNFQYVRPEV